MNARPPLGRYWRTTRLDSTASRIPVKLSDPITDQIYMPEQTFGPSLTLDAPPVQAVEPPKVVRLFGKELEQISSNRSCITWSTHFSAICVSVQFSAPNKQFPWAGQIQGDTLQQSHAFSDVLEVERWLEHRLVALRQDLLKAIPEQVSPELRKNLFTPTPPTPKLFGQSMELLRTLESNTSRWWKDFEFAQVGINSHVNGWKADLHFNNTHPTSPEFATVKEVQDWVERELVNARNKIAAAIPPTYGEAAATEVIPELLGIPLTWEKDSWVLMGIQELCDIRLMDAGDGNFIPRLTLPKFETVPLAGAINQLENVLGGLYEIIDLSVVKQKPGEVVKLFSKKSAWLPLTREPLEAHQFLVTDSNSIGNAPTYMCHLMKDGTWKVEGGPNLSWWDVLRSYDKYAPIPE